MNHVFISYVREDSAMVERLAKDLRQYGVEVWLDRSRLRPGERWQQAIRRAIRDGTSFVACFSNAYTDRQRSYMNEELTQAIEELRQRPTERIWFIPVLLSETIVPDRSIGGGETLRDLNWVSLYEDWERGVQQILDAVLPIGEQLASASGVRYSRLAQLLQLRQWREADEETALKFLEASRKVDALDVEDIWNFPCDDLRIIDRLWTEASDGRFGLSVQARLWLGLGPLPSYNLHDEYLKRTQRFMELIEWSDPEVPRYDDGAIKLIWNLSAPQGHLPGALVPVRLNMNAEGEKAVGGMWFVGLAFNALFERILQCGLIRSA